MRADPLLLVALLSAPALADFTDCEAVRRTIAIATRRNVEVTGLRQLEPQVCAATANHATCDQLSEFWMLAMALREPSDVISTLQAQRATWCDTDAEPAGSILWNDGSMLRSPGGTLTWPNGSIARSTAGNWWSPESVRVRSESGVITWPNGNPARSASGRWTLPSGMPTDEGRLASLACSTDLQWCRFFLAEASHSAGVHRDLALLGLGVLAGRE
jgi:hypothetical protein